MSNESTPSQQNQILAALVAKFEAERMEGYATLNLYLNNPSAVADHANIVGQAATLVRQIADAEGCLQVIASATAQKEGE